MLIALIDFAEMTAAFLIFPLVIFIPGYVVAYYSKLYTTSEALPHWSIGLIFSTAICPVIFYFLIHLGGFILVWTFLIISCLIFIYILQRNLSGFIAAFKYPVKKTGYILVFIISYVFIAILVIDFDHNGRLFRPLMTYDYVKHVSVTNTISRTGLPPINPSFHPGTSLPLFYYYYWFLICSIVDLIGRDIVGPRGAVFASIVWSGIGLLGIIRLYLTTLGPRIVRGIKKSHYKYGYFLLLVSGLDLLPIWLDLMVGNDDSGELAVPLAMWWNDQVASWFSTIIWTPHHCAAFVVCMFAFHIIITVFPKKGKASRIGMFVVALSLATSFGLSIWVTLVAGIFLIVWTLATWAKGWFSETKKLVFTGILALAFALPFIIELQQASFLQQTPVIFQVRDFVKINNLLRDSSVIIKSLANLLVLPVNYGLEFGFFAMGGLLYWSYRKKLDEKLNRAEFFLIVMTATSFFVCTFFRSSIANNDLGWRGFLFAQFVLLLFSIPLIAFLRQTFSSAFYVVEPMLKKVILGMLIISSVYFVFDAYVGRVYIWGIDHNRTTPIRKAYEWVATHTPPAAIIQHNPDEIVEYFHALYGNRQTIISDDVFGKLYGISGSMYDDTFEELKRLFQPDISQEEALSYAKSLDIDAIFLKDTDPIWHDSSSWLNGMQPIYESSCCRIYPIQPMPLTSMTKDVNE